MSGARGQDRRRWRVFASADQVHKVWTRCDKRQHLRFVVYRGDVTHRHGEVADTRVAAQPQGGRRGPTLRVDGREAVDFPVDRCDSRRRREASPGEQRVRKVLTEYVQAIRVAPHGGNVGRRAPAPVCDREKLRCGRPAPEYLVKRARLARGLVQERLSARVYHVADVEVINRERDDIHPPHGRGVEDRALANLVVLHDQRRDTLLRTEDRL